MYFNYLKIVKIDILIRLIYKYCKNFDARSLQSKR